MALDRVLFDERMAELYPFQQEGVPWLAERRTAYLADEMGMGKSPQQILAADGLEIPFIQVVCPSIAVTDWCRKFARWSAMGRKVYASTHAHPIAPARVQRNSAVICSYETALTHRKLLQANPHGGLLIEDEAHYLKNPATRRARAMYGKDCAGTDSHAIIQAFDYVWPASGTPVPNGDPREMYPHVRALRPYSLLLRDGSPMTYTDWCDEFCVFQPGLGTDKVINVRNEPRFLKILGDFMKRRLGDVAGLPEVRFEVYPMEAKNVSRKLASDAWPELAEALRFILDAADAGDLESQLEEQYATLRRLTGLLKIEATVDLVGEELRTGQLDKVLILAWHVDVVNEISRRLSQFGSGAITGSTPDKERWASIDAFNDGRHRVLAGQILAAGTNVSAPCRHVVFAETDWNPENNRQAAYRTRRIDGHRDPILARLVSIHNTIDDLMQQAARRKLNQARRLLPT